MSTSKEFGLNGVQAWPTMLFNRQWASHPQESTGLICFLRGLQQEQSNRIQSGIAVGSKSEHGIYESDFDLFKRDDAGLQRLVKFIEESLAIAVCVASNQEFRPQDLQVDFADSWYHIANEGGFHDAHVHHGCSWCGIYYLQLGVSATKRGEAAPNGGSRFYCPFNNGGGYRDFGNQYLSASIDPPIREGMLLIFPSYLLHSGLPYRGASDRIVLAFNAQIFARNS